MSMDQKRRMARWRQALERAREDGDVVEQASIWNAMGHEHRERGRHKEVRTDSHAPTELCSV